MKAQPKLYFGRSAFKGAYWVHNGARIIGRVYRVESVAAYGPRAVWRAFAVCGAPHYLGSFPSRQEAGEEIARHRWSTPT
jgi:hypothetical protein